MLSYLPYLLLVAGFVFLIKGADLLVSGASSLGRRAGISDLVIGLTVVAFGTSSPELFVNLMAIARKVIVFDFKELAYSYVFATAAVLFALGVTYWLITRKEEKPASRKGN